MARKTFFTGNIRTRQGFMTGKNGIQAAADLLDQPLHGFPHHCARVTPSYPADLPRE